LKARSLQFLWHDCGAKRDKNIKFGIAKLIDKPTTTKGKKYSKYFATCQFIWSRMQVSPLKKMKLQLQELRMEN